MKQKLSSRQRLLSAINHEEPDHVPLSLKWWGRPYLAHKDDGWSNEFQRVAKTLKLGLDDTITLKLPLLLNPEVKVKTTRLRRPEEKYPLLVKEYQTPKGTLRRVIRQTPDWPHGDDVPLFSDFLIPKARSVKYLVENEEDLEALSCLFCKPAKTELRSFFKEADRVKRFAKKYEVLVEAGVQSEGGVECGVVGADALPWICGLENTIKAAYMRPKFIHQLLDMILEWDMTYIELAAETGIVDMIVHRGWYENAEFWPPRLYETFIMPRIQKLSELAHYRGLKFCYIMTMGLMPLLDFFKEMDIDVLYGVDPIQGGADIHRIKLEIGDRICLWGGLNAAVTLGRWGQKQVEEAVASAVRILAPGSGFIMSAIDQLFEDTSWENVEAMIRTWRRVGTYPKPH